ncbi:response regulator [Candidatus Riflebacteria bacterium]
MRLKAMQSAGKKAGEKVMAEEKIVLLVEDEISHRLLLSYSLENFSIKYGIKIKIIEANDGTEALGHIYKGEKNTVAEPPLIPDLILSDNFMPVMNGIELLEELRKDRFMREVPFVMLSVISNEKEKQHAKNAGAIAYLKKPLDFKEFYSLLNGLWQGRPEAHSLRILIIDGAHDTAKLHKKIIADVGHIGELAFTGKKGLEKLKTIKFDLVLLSHSLPEMTGRELLLEILKREQSIPVIMITGSGDERLAVEVIKSGAADYFVKDKDQAYLNELPAKIAQSFIRWRLGEQSNRMQDQIMASEERLRMVMQSSLDALVMVDEDENILEWNQRAEEIFGWKKEQVLKKSLTQTIIPPEFNNIHKSSFLNFLDNFHEKKPARRIETSGLNIEGEKFPIEITLSSMEHRGKRIFSAFIRDISERKKAEIALKASEEKFRTLLESSSDCICHLSLDGKYRYMNAGGMKLKNFQTENDFLGKNFIDLVKEEFKQNVNVALDKAARGETTKLDYVTQSEQKSDCWWESVVSPIKDDTGKVAGLLKISRDISKRKEIIEELRFTMEEAEEATRLKDKFVSLLAHDLKSPLTSVVGLLDLFITREGGNFSDPQQDILDKIKNSGKHMIGMIEKLLNLSRLQTGRIIARPKFLNVYFTAEICIESLIFLAQQKGIKIQNDIPRTTKIYADPSLFPEIIKNLLSNAIKFCRVDDMISLSLKGDKPHAIAVEDTGIGMSEKIVANLFLHETRVSRVGTAGEKGTGLGLIYCQEIMKAHGGNIKVESNQEEGSTFYIEFPRINEKPRILVIDREEQSSFLIRQVLQGLDMEVYSLQSCEEALEFIKKTQPHAILCDLTMPGMSGLEFLEVIKGNDETVDIPVLMMSSDPSYGKSDGLIFSLGAEDFITKPVFSANLIARLTKFLF